jgi:hypothetical protein
MDVRSAQIYPVSFLKISVLRALAIMVANQFKSRRRLQAENLWLRHQLNVALRHSPAHLRLSGIDRALFVWLARLWPDLLDSIQVVKPETVMRWHRRAFERIGAGNQGGGQGGQELIVGCAN